MSAFEVSLLFPCWHCFNPVLLLSCLCIHAPPQKDLLESCDIDVVLVGHAMSQDQEHAELFEIEW